MSNNEISWDKVDPMISSSEQTIDSDILDEMVEELSLYEYFTDYENLDLVPTGHGMYTAHCPFSDHEDIHTRSFTVYEDTHSFFCFGCQRGGKVFQWLTDPAGKAMHFLGAVSLVASITGINPNLDPIAALDKLGENINKSLEQKPQDYLSKEELNFVVSRLGYLHIKSSQYDHEEVLYVEEIYKVLDGALLHHEQYVGRMVEVKNALLVKIQERKDILKKAD